MLNIMHAYANKKYPDFKKLVWYGSSVIAEPFIYANYISIPFTDWPIKSMADLNPDVLIAAPN